MQSILYKDSIAINDHISVRIPTVGEIIDREDEYYGLVSMLTATPYDMMVGLDDIGIDFETISDYELFLILFRIYFSDKDVSLVFGDLDLSGFYPDVNPQNGMIVLRDENSEAVIDRAIYEGICQALRRIHNIKRESKKPANAETKKYMIERARKKLSRRKGGGPELEGLIVALVNTEQFHYGFKETLGLTIYQFNESARQIISKVNFDNLMHGVYSGTVSMNDLKEEELNWLTHK